MSFPPNLFVPMPNPMLILVTNSGSASLKLDLMRLESPGAASPAAGEIRPRLEGKHHT